MHTHNPTPEGPPLGLIARAGFAKRAENFEATHALAAAFTGLSGVKWHWLTDTLFDAFPLLGVSEGAHRVLMLLCRHLTSEDWADGTTLVWPSNEGLAQNCGVTLRQIQNRLRELEAAGLILREYTRINSRRPRGGRKGRIGGGLDLAPLGARLASLRSEAEAMKAEAASLRAARHQRFDDLPSQDIASRDESHFAHKQSHLNHSRKTVPPAASAPGRMDAPRPLAAGIYPSSKPDRPAAARQPNAPEDREGRFSEDVSAPTNLAERARDALLAKIELSPTLLRLAPYQDLKDLALGGILARLGDCVVALFPDRNTALTWEWAVKRHGWRAGLCLVAALEDPTARDRYRLFGYFATCVAPGQLDLSSNFKRIEKLREPETGATLPEKPATSKVAAPAGTPKPEIDPVWRKITAALSADIGPSAVLNWISQLVFGEIEAGTLRLFAPSSFVADYVRQHYETALINAAQRAGEKIRHLRLDVRN